MNDDDDYNLRQTIRFEDVDLDEEGPSGPEEWLRILDGKDMQTMTDPFRPALDLRSTRLVDVPQGLIEGSRRTNEHDSLAGWERLESVIDHRGYLVARLDGSEIKPGDRVEILIRKLEVPSE